LHPRAYAMEAPLLVLIAIALERVPYIAVRPASRVVLHYGLDLNGAFVARFQVTAVRHLFVERAVICF